MWVIVGRLHGRVQWVKRHGFKEQYKAVPYDPTYTITWNFGGKWPVV